MPEQFRVIRRDDERRAIQKSGEPLDLRDTLVEKMLRVFACGLEREVALVNFLLSRAAGDAEILHAGEPAILRRRQMRLDIIEIQVEADVAVEITVTRVAGIAFVLAPDLPRGIKVAPERCDAVWRENRRERAVARARARIQNAVRVEDEPADVRLLQKNFDAGNVGAFRQPDSARVAPEATAIMVARRQNLRADGRWMIREQRQQSVRRAGGDDFQRAFVLKPSETR